MGFGLSITDNTLQEPDKKDWVNYNGIMMPRNTARAKKAWETMNSRGHKSKKEPYGIRENKQKILNKIKECIEKDDYPNKIISLETSEYNLPSMFIKSNKRKLRTSKFFIAQIDKKEYLKMLSKKPENVVMLYHGNVADFKYLGGTFDYAFLDFCRTFEKEKDTIIELVPLLSNCKMIFLTFCLRRNEKEIEDYKFDMANKIFELLSDFYFYDVIPYRDSDHAPMISIFLKSKELTPKYCMRCNRRIGGKPHIVFDNNTNMKLDVCIACKRHILNNNNKQSVEG